MAEPTEPGAAPAPILYLDVDDEITSAAARIRAIDGDRLALVVPFGSRLATSRINFRLLAREAVERGKAIEIVAADASARALAASAGLVVHPSVAAFEGRETGGTNGTEPPSGEESAAAVAADAPDQDTATKVFPIPTAAAGHPALAKPRDGRDVPLVGPSRPPIRRRAVAAIGVSLLAVVTVAAWAAVFVLPSATITVAPRSEDAGPLELTVEARRDVPAPDPAALLIPARDFTFDLDVSDTFPATGIKITETKAGGTVQFSHFDAFRTRRIDAGSIVATESDIEFVILADVTLPPAGIDFTDPLNPRIIPSTSSVGVEAVIVGPGGNVNNNTITVLPRGVNKNAVSVTNPEATSGGARTESPQVSQDDVDAALAALRVQLGAELASIATDPVDVPPGTRLFGQTGVVGEPTPDVDPASVVGTDTAEFELGLSATGTLLGVDPAPLDGLAAERLAGATPDGWEVADGSIQVTVGEPSVFGETVTFPVTVRGIQVRNVDRDAVIAAARGQLLADARARLASFGDVEVSLWPDWVTNVPDDPSKVTVTILAPRPAATEAPGS